MLVGDHKILKIALFILIVLFLFYIFLYNPKICSDKNIIRASTIFFPFLNLIAIIFSIILFKKENLILKIFLLFFVVLMWLISLYLNFLVGKSCFDLLFALSIHSILIPFILMIFY
jgi:hypothetical protein